MAKDLVIYKCSACGFTAEVIDPGKTTVPPACCGKPMGVLAPNTVEASTEKHLPVGTFTEDGKLLVKVGSVSHPMAPEHYIQWIIIVHGDTVQRVDLAPGQEPQAQFCVCGATEVDMYEYCNLHGLWKSVATK